MISLKDFKKYSINTHNNIYGGIGGTYGSGSCATQGGQGNDCQKGEDDCKTYTYTDDCDGNNRVITGEEIWEGPCSR